MKQKEFDKYREIAEADRIEARLEQIGENLDVLIKIMAINRMDAPIIGEDKCQRALKIRDDVEALYRDILKEISDAKYSFGCDYMGTIPDMAAIKLVGAVADAGLKYIQESVKEAMEKKKKED